MKRSSSNGLADARKGVSHFLDGLPCQDSALLSRSGDGWLICIADGASGATHAAEASRIATRAAHKWMSNNAITSRGWRKAMRESLVNAHDAVRLAAISRDAPIEDFSTTLLVAVATPCGVFAAQVGDGSLVVEIANGSLAVVLKETKSGASNVTRFVSDAYCHRFIQYGSYRGKIAGVVAFTDGLEPAAFDATGQPWPGFINPIFTTLRERSFRSARKQIRNLLDSPRLRAITSDDVSLAAATIEGVTSWLPRWNSFFEKQR